MEILKKANSQVEKIWGKQKRKEEKYRLLSYTVQTKSEAGDLLYNVISGELLLLSEEEKAFLDGFPGELPEELPAGTLAQTGETLIEKHFLVPLSYDEGKTVKQLRKLYSVMKKKKDISGYTILPTTYCNARCFYCYESGIEFTHMTPETAHDLVNYIEAHCKEKKVTLSWFGGEPLLGAKIISQISKELTEKGIEYHSSMISNGIRFDEEMIREAKECWKLQNVQITIDGTEEIYNEVKSYVDIKKESPYRRILKNIRLLSEGDIRVSIRINLGFHNIEDIRALIKELSEYFADCKNVSMYVHELFDGEGTDPTHYTEQEKAKLMELVNDFNQYADQKGKYEKKRTLPALSYSHCMADNDSSLIVYPNGDLVKCEHYDPSKDKAGSIYSEEWNQEILKSWKEQAELPHCLACPLYPSCVQLVRCPETGDCYGVKQEKKLEEVKENMCLYAKEQRREEKE